MNLSRPNYKAWLISKADFPGHGSLEDKIKFLLGYGVLAPSQHNTQPWLFEIRQNILLIKPDPSRSLPMGDPVNSGLFISLGACSENIQQAANQFGMSCDVRFSDNAAKLSFDDKGPISESDEALRAITDRHSDKYLYSERAIDQLALDELGRQEAKGVEYQIVTDPKLLSKIVELHRQATTSVSSDVRFVRELVQWLRTNGTKAYDGMPGSVSGNSAVKSVVGKVLLSKKPQIFKKMVGHDVALLASSPAIVVWAAQDQSSTNMFYYGRHIERLWLKATELGLAAHPMHSICAEEKPSDELAKLLGLKGRPVFLVRLGYHPDTGLRTPRKGATCS